MINNIFDCLSPHSCPHYCLVRSFKRQQQQCRIDFSTCFIFYPNITRSREHATIVHISNLSTTIRLVLTINKLLSCSCSPFQVPFFSLVDVMFWSYNQSTPLCVERQLTRRLENYQHERRPTTKTDEMKVVDEDELWHRLISSDFIYSGHNSFVAYLWWLRHKR